MPSFSSLPGEVRNKIFALIIPQSVSIAPCRSSSLLADPEDLYTLEQADSYWHDAQSLPQILFWRLTVNEHDDYDCDATTAQACTALLQVDRATRHQTAAQFYESNNFLFPGCIFLQAFLGRLSTTTLSYIQKISISVYLNVYPQWSSAGRVPFGLKGVDIEKMWSWLGYIGKCRNLRHLNISSEADTCEGQEYLLDQFKHYGRERIGLLPKINVAFIDCLIRKDRKKSQHWRWGSKSGSQGGKSYISLAILR